MTTYSLTLEKGRASYAHTYTDINISFLNIPKQIENTLLSLSSSSNMK